MIVVVHSCDLTVSSILISILFFPPFSIEIQNEKEASFNFKVSNNSNERKLNESNQAIELPHHN
jgi:hypothetical protein